MDEIVQPWSDAAEARMAAEQGITDLMAAVQEEADASAPPLPAHCEPTFAEPELLGDTLAPDQVGLARYQLALARAGWRSLEEVLVSEASRVREDLPPVRVLRLSDADDTFGFHLGDAVPVRQASFRLYAAPLGPAEVLLSLLGSSPKVVLHHPPAGTTVWVPDQWARLSDSHPGALALALTIRQVHWQLSRGTTGVIRQYVGREELGRLRVPALPASRAERLHQQFSELLERRRDAELRLKVLRERIDGLVTQSIGGRS
jgi:hypothetical protein